MKQLLNKGLALVLVLAMTLALATSVIAEEVVPVLISTNESVEPASELANLLDYYETVDSLNDWELICALNDAGYTFDADFFASLEWGPNAFNGQAPSFYGSRILALLAMDQDPSNYYGQDLLLELTSMMADDGSFGTPTDQVYAMAALKVTGSEFDEAKALEALGLMQNTDGGFGYAVGSSDVDSTGTALITLAEFVGTEAADEMIERAISYMKSQQMETAGFGSWGSENSNSIARAISGLIAVGEDINDTSWLKAGKSMLEALIEYRLEDGTYSWLSDPLETSGFSTKQVLMAYADMVNEAGFLSGLSLKTLTYDIRIEGVSDTIIDTELTRHYVGELTVKEALVTALDEAEIGYLLTDTTFGSYLSAIGSESAGAFAGYDGWMYLINDGSGMGLDYDVISDGDKLVFYYGGFAPETLVPSVIIPSRLGKDEPMLIKVQSTYDEFDANWTPTPVTVDIAGVTVVFNNKTYETDAYGIARIPQSEVVEGINTYSISQDMEGELPGIVRESGQVSVSIDPTVLYLDDVSIAPWAYQAIYQARREMLMIGYMNSIHPKEYLTKTQLITMLTRLSDDLDFDYEIPEITDGQAYVTRVEYAQILVDFYKFDASGVDFGYTDLSGLTVDEVEAINRVSEVGLLTGYNNQFMPHDHISREMAAVIMMRIYDMMD